MIDDLDRSVVKLFELEFGSPLPFDVSFAIPDKNFKPVSGSRNTLNCYLYDIRENRDLRDTERRLQRRPGGEYTLERAPCRVRASYCFTAWSPAAITPNVDAHLDEHNLLAAVLQVLLRYPELPAPALLGTLVGQRPPLPTAVVQPDSARNSGDFWNAIGGQLRPSLEYSVTIALDYQRVEEGPLVKSLLTRMGEREDGATRIAGAFDERYAIGGSVWSSSPAGASVADAWVRVDETGEVTVADGLGRFIIDRVVAGTYNLTVRATGFQQGNRTLRVPSVGGSYDITLDPL